MSAFFGRMTGRRWHGIVAVVASMVIAMIPFGAAFAQQAPPGTGPKNLHRFQVANAPAQFDLVQLGLDVLPGAAASAFSFGGTAYNTVMGGEITVGMNGTGTTYKDGDTWVSEAGQAFDLRNTGQDRAVIFSSILLPKEASLTTSAGGSQAQSLPAGQTTLFLTRFPVSNAPSPLDLVQVELDQASGSWAAAHTHPGAAYNTVIRGKLMVRADSKDTTYSEGGSWVNPAGQVHAVQNVSDVASRAFTTFLVPRSATQVTVPVTNASSSAASGINVSAANDAGASAPGANGLQAPTVAGSAPKLLPVTGSAAPARSLAWPISLAVLAIVVIVGVAILFLRRNARRAQLR